MRLLNISKVGLYGLFLNYYCYYIIKGSFIPHGTYIFLTIIAIGLVLDIAQSGAFYLSNHVKLWIAYGVLAFVTTLAFYSSSGLVSDIIKYFQRIFIVVAVAYICEQEKKVQFAINLMAVTAVGCAYALLSSLGNYLLKLDLTTGADVSTNDMGCIMAYGCFAILFVDFKMFNNIANFFRMAAIVAFVSVIFLAGSRKSIVAVVICFGLLILLCGSYYLKKQSLFSFFILVVVGIAAYILIRKYLMPYATGTDLYQRVLGDHAESAASSDELRIELYQYAVQDFLRNPFIGDGFNRFVKLHGNYTHSTYAEPIACSGMIGLLYLLPYGYILKRQFELISMTRHHIKENIKQRVMFAFLIAFLFIGVGIPYMYKDIPQVALGMFIASQSIALSEYRRRHDKWKSQ